MDHITLLGAESVRAAGSAISAAADDMGRACTNFVAAVDRLDRIVERFEVAVAALGEHAEAARP